LLNNIYRTPVSGVFRRKDSGFAVCGEKPASVSQFVAGIRHGRSSQQEQDEDDGAVWLQEGIRATSRGDARREFIALAWWCW
jgi:hypothetical protein